MTGSHAEKTSQKSTIVAGRFTGRGDATVNTKRIARWKGSRAMTDEVTGWRLRASIAGNSRQLDKIFHLLSEFFHRQSAEKGARMTSRPLITIGV